MSFKDRYAINKKAAEDGQWVSMGGGLDLKVRRLSSKFVRDHNTKLNKPYTHLTKGGKSLPTDLQEELSKKLCAEAILMDWRDTPKSDEKGAPRRDPVGDEKEGALIPFSKEEAYTFLEEYPDFMEDVVEQSSNIENFRAEELKEIEGNS